MSTPLNIIHSQEARDLLIQGLTAFSKFRNLTNINPLDNYGFREAFQILELRQLLSSIDKVPGRTGPDAKADLQGYSNIELKSTGFKKECTINNWPSAMFDMSKKGGIDKLYAFEGFGHGLFDPFTFLPIASYFIPKDHIKKLHNVFDKKVSEYKIYKESKETLREAIYITLTEVREHIDLKDIIFFKYGKIVSSIEGDDVD